MEAGMAEQIEKPERRPSRPRVHKGEPKTLSVRTTEKHFRLMHGLLATIRLADKRMDPDLGGARTARPWTGENQSPELVRHALAKFEKNR
jgi:hypothetical protein